MALVRDATHWDEARGQPNPELRGDDLRTGARRRDRAAVVLAGGSTIAAPVMSNVYNVLDPSWSPPVFVDT
jgi:hypothetical protein